MIYIHIGSVNLLKPEQLKIKNKCQLPKGNSVCPFVFDTMEVVTKGQRVINIKSVLSCCCAFPSLCFCCYVSVISDFYCFICFFLLFYACRQQGHFYDRKKKCLLCPVSPLMRRQLSLQAEGYKMVTIFSLNGCLPQAFTGYSSSLQCFKVNISYLIYIVAFLSNYYFNSCCHSPGAE